MLLTHEGTLGVTLGRAWTANAALVMPGGHSGRPGLLTTRGHS